MTVAIETVRKTLLSKGDPLTDTRETWLVTTNWTKANSDDNVAVITGLSEIYSYTAIGNIAAKPYNATVSGGTVTFIDGGSSSNTIGSCQITGRK